jgi:hypothetical protein
MGRRAGYWKEYRRRNIKRIRETERRSHNLPEAKAAKRRYYKEYAKRRDPAKKHARNLLQSAVRHGKIKRRPCEICQSERSQAHHEDYSKPLEVRWLCQLHHAEVHSEA